MNEEQNEQEWLSEYFDKYVPPEVLHCKILKCKIQEDPRNEFTELVYFQCIINTEKLEYILEICDEGIDGFFLSIRVEALKMILNQENGKTSQQLKKWGLFLDTILIEQNLDFSKENIDSIEEWNLN